MAKNTASIAEAIRGFMNKNRIDVWTMNWAKFGELTERERIKSAFEKQLQEELASRAILLAFGRSAVVICRDFDFSPRPFK